MTDRTRDLDRVLNAFLGDGPSEAPDRAIDAALDQIAVTAQVRRAAAPWRSAMRNRVPLALASAAAVVVLIAGGLYLSRNRPPVAASQTPGTSSPAPSASAGTALPTPLPSPIAAALAALSEVDHATTAARTPTGLTLSDQNRLFSLHDSMQAKLEAGDVQGAMPFYRDFAAAVDSYAPRLQGAPGDRLRAAVTALGAALDAALAPSASLGAAAPS